VTARSRARVPEAGFSLVEVMITLALTAVAMAAIYGAFFRTQRATQVVVAEVGARQGVRAAMQIIERDLRMAGSGWGRIQVDGAYAGSPLTLYGVNPGYGGASVTATDSLSILGAWDAGTTLRAAMPTVNDAVQCVTTAGFGSGDLVVVSDGASAHLFEATSVQTSPADIAHATSSPFNQPGGHLGWPGSGYGSASRVFKVGWVSYRMDSTSYQRPSLVRWAVGQPPALVAYDVESFQVWYRLDDGTLTRNPTNLAMINQVIPVLYAAPQASASAGEDSARATVKPRAF
jgi:prepilin-type N-terminal cleavage/methylation domain-containing protein